MKTAVKVENLVNSNIIHHKKQERYSVLYDSLSHTVRSITRRIIHPLQANTEEREFEEFYALKDINFEIQQGDRVGIIGRKGVGKSTLLKILSRITASTIGKVIISGHVVILLEEGTCFQPELSGLENIYFNGAVQGARETEIKQIFSGVLNKKLTVILSEMLLSECVEGFNYGYSARTYQNV